MPILQGSGALCLELPSKRARPLVERGALVGIFSIESSTRSRTCLPVTLDWLEGTRKTSALLDSGAEESFLDAETAVRWGSLVLHAYHLITLTVPSTSDPELPPSEVACFLCHT